MDNADNSAPRYLKLSNNKIGRENDDHRLPAGIFNEMTRLQEVWLDHNELEGLNNNEFKFQEQVRFLTLEYRLVYKKCFEKGRKSA